jgi:hypothetical protein|tara:strand:- start:723 stop:854 length:132 start_codon:yes stop_codon:yes gene_type:complete
MKHYGSWSFIESYNLPVQIRRWFIARINKQYKEEAEERKKQNR